MTRVSPATLVVEAGRLAEELQDAMLRRVEHQPAAEPHSASSLLKRLGRADGRDELADLVGQALRLFAE